MIERKKGLRNPSKTRLGLEGKLNKFSGHGLGMIGAVVDSGLDLKDAVLGKFEKRNVSSLSQKAHQIHTHGKRAAELSKKKK